MSPIRGELRNKPRCLPHRPTPRATAVVKTGFTPAERHVQLAKIAHQAILQLPNFVHPLGSEMPTWARAMLTIFDRSAEPGLVVPPHFLVRAMPALAMLLGPNMP